MAPENFGIGSPVWVRDENKRHYFNDDGSKRQSPNPRHYWVKRQVVDETSRSWVIGISKDTTWNNFKLSKKDMRENELTHILFSEDEVEKWSQMEKDSVTISRFHPKRRRQNWNKIREIARLIEELEND